MIGLRPVGFKPISFFLLVALRILLINIKEEK